MIKSDIDNSPLLGIIDYIIYYINEIKVERRSKMEEKYIQISSFNDIYDFLRHTTAVDGDVTLYRGRNAIDAKSTLGVLSIDMSNKVIIQFPKAATAFNQYIEQFVVS